MVSTAISPRNKSSRSDLRHHNVALHYLLAFDGSQHAQAAVKMLNDIHVPKSKVTTLSVIPTQKLSGHEALQKAITQAVHQLTSAGYIIDSKLKAGNPAASINEFAIEHDVDLIVLGAKGLRATLGILLGGVAQQVVEYSSRPVLVVRSPYKGLRRILFVTDGSPSSQSALEYLTPQCEKDSENKDTIRKHCFWLSKESEITVMHVLPPSISTDTSSQVWTVGPEVLYLAPPPVVDKEAIEANEEKEGHRILSEALETLMKTDILAEKVLCRGDAATEIIDFVNKREIDLIICGSRGLSQISGWLLGSVSRKLVHYANCSVLVVK